MTWGFNDNVCPPTTSYIVYNMLNCPKESLITPINEHWTSSDTEYGHLLWIKKTSEIKQNNHKITHRYLPNIKSPCYNYNLLQG